MDPSLEGETQLIIALLELLSTRSWVPTGELLQALDISAPALAVAIERLCGWGLRIRTVNGEAYRVESPIHLLQVSRIRDGLPADWRGEMGVTVMPVVDSTNARLLCDWPDQVPWAILAEYQTNGRGRRGHRWHSPFGVNLYLSVAWTFDRSTDELSALPLAMGVCCTRALARLGLEKLAIKWPNDLWINEAKLGGILVESYHVGEVLRAVVGVGINVNMELACLRPEEVLWTTLRQEMTAQNKDVPDRNVLASALLANMADGLKLFSASGFGPFLNEWKSLDLMRDRAVSVSGPKKMTGIARGIDDKGALRVETPTGLVLVDSGDVTVRGVSE